MSTILVQAHLIPKINFTGERVEMQMGFNKPFSPLLLWGAGEAQMANKSWATNLHDLRNNYGKVIFRYLDHNSIVH